MKFSQISYGRIKLGVCCLLLFVVSNSNAFRIGLITDTHITATFDPSTSDQYTHAWPFSLFYKSSTYAPLGRYLHRTAKPLFNSALAQMKTILPNPDLLVYCGDYIDRMINLDLGGWFYPPFWTRFSTLKRIIADVTHATTNAFPGIPVAYAIGNHDKLDQSKDPIPWLPFMKSEYNYVYELWIKDNPANQKWNTAENEKTMKEGLYWMMDLAEVRILSVNTNYWRYKEVRDEEIRADQYAWIEKHLEGASRINKKIMIVTHIPIHDCPEYDKLFYPLFYKYRETLSIVMAGHLHDLRYYASNHPTTGPFHAEVANQALSSQDYFSPGISLYEVNTSNGQFTPIKMQQYAMELGRTYNKTDIGDGAEFWRQTFDSAEDLGFPDLTAGSLYHFLNSVYKEDISMKMKYDFYQANHRPLDSISFEGIKKGSRGYVNLPTSRTYMHYWLLRSKLDTNSSPLVIFLEGGPGCDPELHLLNGIGNYNLGGYGTDTKDLMENKFSWGEIANLLFIDQPIGVGLSPVLHDHNSGVHDLPSSTTKITAELLQFINQFFIKYPDLKFRKTFFVAHDYAFHYVADLISHKDFPLIPLNLSGFLFINPLIMGAGQLDMMVESAGNLGLLNPFKYLTGRMAAALCRIYTKIGINSFATFPCQLAINIVQGVQFGNYKSHDFPLPLDPKVESLLEEYMREEMIKTPTAAGIPHFRCNKDIFGVLKWEIYKDYTSYLGQILDLELPVFVVFGEKALWAGKGGMEKVFGELGGKYNEQVKKGDWHKWQLESNSWVANMLKAGKLWMFQVLGATEFPLLHDPKLSFDIFSNFLLA